MRLFNRKEPRSATDSTFTDDERERVNALWRLTALPRDEFDATYGDLIGRCWRAVAAGTAGAWTSLRFQALAHADAALKVRRAYVLPRFAAAEDAARLAEVMSFALAACVLAERFAGLLGRASAPGWSPLLADLPAGAVLADRDVPRSFGALLLPRLVGPAGHEWLAQEREALWAAVAYFGEGPSELREIGHDAAARIGLPIAGVAPESPPAAESAKADPKAPALTTPTDPHRETAAESATAAIKAAAPMAEGEEGPLPRVGGPGKGWDWINWVRAGVHEGRIAVNAAGAWLHNVDGEAFVVVPDGYDAFDAPDGAGAKTVRNRVARLGRHRSRRSAGHAVEEHRALLGDGRQVPGMVFPGELFWDDRPPPASKAALEDAIDAHPR